MRNLIGVLTAATLLAGCTAYSTFDPLKTSGAFLTTEGAVTVKATFTPGGYVTPTPAPMGYRTATVVPAMTKDAVDHVTLSAFSLEGETETPLKDADGADWVKTVSADEAESGLKIGGLTIGKRYRVKATAYQVTEPQASYRTAAAATGSTPVSAEVTADFTVDKLQPTAALNLQLIDVSFDGWAEFPGFDFTVTEEVTHDGQPIEIDGGSAD